MSTRHIGRRRQGLQRLLAAGAVALALALTATLVQPSASAAPKPRHHPNVEQWRPLVEEWFGHYGYADEVDYALMVMWGESNGVIKALNPTSDASGLFQHLPKYWKDRSGRSGWGGAYIFDPEANIAVAAWLRATSPTHGWKHWAAISRFPVGSMGPDTWFDTSTNRYVAMVKPGNRPQFGPVTPARHDHPGISILKRPATDEVVELPVGTDVTWVYQLSNSGDVDLWAPYVWDDAVGEVLCDADRLQPDESITCFASHPAAAGLHSDAVYAWAWTADDREVGAEAEAGYRGIAESVITVQVFTELSPDVTMVAYLVRNTGQTNLWSLYIWDDGLGEIDCFEDDLAAGGATLCFATGPAAASAAHVTVWAWDGEGKAASAVATRTPAV